MASHRPRENWSSRLGVILAVSGSAVGLGNFLRFPGQAAQYGGGAFMVAYFISFLLIGLPICWAEWSMGRSAGQKGYNSCPGIFNYIARHPAAKYAGVIGVIIPVIIYMYYVTIEAWCLGYAVNFVTGKMAFGSPEEAATFWGKFIGAGGDGSAMGFNLDQVGGYLVLVFVLNFFLVYRGLSKGIEWFCKYAMPTLVLLAIVILVRVLTLGAPDPSVPENNVVNGLGFMWNPEKVLISEKAADGTITQVEVVDAAQIAAAEADPARTVTRITVWEQLQKPQLWLAAAGQIFFSLSVGFGIILTYASYLRRNDDVVLSGLAACSANEFCEVGLGGLITLPAGVAFLGVSGMVGMGTFDLGFKVLPMVFASMPAGNVFGFFFFFLLFLAAVTSSLSMLQPGIAFLEEAMAVGRKTSVAILGVITAMGCGFVVWFSKDVKALDTLDFWVGTFLIYVLASIQVIIFAWVLGIRKGFDQAHQGAAIRIPRIFGVILKYVTPTLLLAIFLTWLLKDVLGIVGEGELSGYITDLVGDKANPVAQISVGLILIVAIGTTLILSQAPIYKNELNQSPSDSRPDA
ncbi:MAG: sodium:calcium symporter [Verrucomicrobiae bacterium]|nr:sodium:calcium symporter [Verrucomicrobiae bacterium]